MLEEDVMVSGVRGTVVGVVEFEYTNQEGRLVKIPLDLTRRPNGLALHILASFEPVIVAIERAREEGTL